MVDGCVCVGSKTEDEAQRLFAHFEFVCGMVCVALNPFGVELEGGAVAENRAKKPRSVE